MDAAATLVLLPVSAGLELGTLVLVLPLLMEVLLAGLVVDVDRAAPFPSLVDSFANRSPFSTGSS